jgi:hypothetical protein
LDVLSGLDSNDPFGEPGVSRVIIGGTRAELGLEAIGVAESIDVGNFAMEETAVVLLDRLSNEAHPDALHAYGVAAGSSRAELVGRAIGTVVVHEAGHLFGNFHTGTVDSRPDIMDHKRPFNIFFGVGPDSTIGTSDDQEITFGPAPYSSEEYFTGMEDTRNTISFGLSVLSTFVDEEERSTQPAPFAISPVFPNPVHGQARLRVTTVAHTDVDIKMYDAIGRLVGIVFRGSVPAGHGQVVVLDPRNLSSGTYLLRASDGRAVAWTSFVIAH